MKTQVLIVGASPLPLVLNRDGSLPERIHIVPRGELLNREAGIVQVLDDKSLTAIVANLNAEKEKRGADWPGLYMGEEHFIYNSEKSSEAFAWAKEFAIDEKGIWAIKPEITDVGEAPIKNKRFKFTSFVTDPNVAGSYEKLDGNRVRILKIDTVGFTNYANGRHLLSPVKNRQPNFAEPGGLADITNIQPRQQMKSVCALLGLSAEADELSVHAAVSKLMNRGDITVTDLATLRTEHGAFKTQNETLLGEQCDTLLDACGVADAKLRNRLAGGLKLLTNREERLAYLLDFGHKPGAKKQETTKPFMNRQDGKQKDGEGEVTEGNGQELATKITNRAGELKGNSPNRSFESCWAQATREQTPAPANS